MLFSLLVNKQAHSVSQIYAATGQISPAVDGRQFAPLKVHSDVETAARHNNFSCAPTNARIRAALKAPANYNLRMSVWRTAEQFPAERVRKHAFIYTRSNCAKDQKGKIRERNNFIHLFGTKIFTANIKQLCIEIESALWPLKSACDFSGCISVAVKGKRPDESINKSDFLCTHVRRVLIKFNRFSQEEIWWLTPRLSFFNAYSLFGENFAWWSAWRSKSKTEHGIKLMTVEMVFTKAQKLGYGS